MYTHVIDSIYLEYIQTDLYLAYIELPVLSILVE